MAARPLRAAPPGPPPAALPARRAPPAGHVHRREPLLRVGLHRVRHAGRLRHRSAVHRAGDGARPARRTHRKARERHERFRGAARFARRRRFLRHRPGHPGLRLGTRAAGTPGLGGRLPVGDGDRRPARALQHPGEGRRQALLPRNAQPRRRRSPGGHRCSCTPGGRRRSPAPSSRFRSWSCRPD